MSWVGGLCLLALCGQVLAETVNGLDVELVAEFVSVDYLWDSTHVRSLYQETGQFVVANNIITGIKVSKSNEIFVSVPRWMSGVPSSLNKLVPNPAGHGYVLSPWPTWEFNEINRTGSLQYAQSFLIDSQNRMWIPDVGRTNFYDANTALTTSGPARLFVVNVTDGTTISVYTFPDSVVPNNNSFLNDLVLDETRGYVYLTNTWADGGILVYDIATNQSHMFTSNYTQRNASYNFCVNDACYGQNGIGASPSDGIALSLDGTVLYWSAVQGPELYAIETSFLRNFSMTNEDFQAVTQLLGWKAGCTDGMLVLPSGDLVYGDLTHSQVGVVSSLGKEDDVTGESLSESSTYMSGSSPEAMTWIDTFSSDPACDDCFYFTSNRLNAFFNATMDFTGQNGANFRIFHAQTSHADDNDEDNGTLSAGAIAGIVIGSTGLVLLVVCAWLQCVRSGAGWGRDKAAPGVEAAQSPLQI